MCWDKIIKTNVLDSEIIGNECLTTDLTFNVSVSSPRTERVALNL
jgi:hypothetical protein